MALYYISGSVFAVIKVEEEGKEIDNWCFMSWKAELIITQVQDGTAEQFWPEPTSLYISVAQYFNCNTENLE